MLDRKGEGTISAPQSINRKDTNQSNVNHNGFTKPFGDSNGNASINQSINHSTGNSMLRPAYMYDRSKTDNGETKKLVIDRKGDGAGGKAKLDKKKDPSVGLSVSNVDTNLDEVDVENSLKEDNEGDVKDDDLERIEVRTLSGRGSKFWLAALINGVVRTTFADSAADITLFPYEMTDGMKLYELKNKFEVTGFRNKEKAVITHYVVVTFEFMDGCVLELRCYVYTGSLIIIGSDTLLEQNVSLNTGERSFTVDGVRLNTCRSESAAKREYHRRNAMSLNDYMNEFESGSDDVLLRTREAIFLPPLECIDVMALVTNRGRMNDGDHTFLSYFDEGLEDLFIPSLTFNDFSLKAPRKVPVTNLTRQGYHLPKGSALGRVKRHVSADDPLAERNVEVYEMNALRREIDRHDLLGAKGEMNESDMKHANVSDVCYDKPAGKVGVASAAPAASKERNRTAAAGAKAAAQGPGVTEKAAAKDRVGEKFGGKKEKVLPEPVKYSTLINQNKVSAETFEKVYEGGIDMDLSLEQDKPEVFVKELIVPDYKMEKQKAEKCEFWPDRAEFLKKFELSHIEPAVRIKVEQLLWDYRHIWYNDKFPRQFKQGLQNCDPVRIRLKEGCVPRKEATRQLSQEKLELLKKHLSDLEEMGVLVEYPAGEWASPVHLVIEHRYDHKSGRNQRKARITIDQRSINKCIKEMAYPLPLLPEFRRHMSRFAIFSNVDCKSWFFQFRVHEGDSKKCLCVAAAGRIFRMVRLSMGCKVSPAIAQAMADMMFKHHKNVRCYLDDFTTFSNNIEEHFGHFEHTLGVCSYYGILLSPQKAHVFTPTMRSLGYQVANKENSMCEEKLEKIRSLTMPTNRKELISVLAFLNFFSRILPRLSEFTAPLRRLARPSVRFKPDSSHVEAFEKARALLLDSTVCVLRTPSQDVNDLIYVFTDSSASSLGSIITQVQPDSPESSNKNLYLIGTFSSVIPEVWESYPIFLLELLSLSETCKKWKWLLAGRHFVVSTDNSTVKDWCCLDKVPKDLARKIIALQEFQFFCVFLESRLNPSDLFSRVSLPDLEKNRGCYERFLSGRVVNARGIQIPLEKLFSERRAASLAKFFEKARKQQMVRALDREDIEKQRAKAEEYLKDGEWEEDELTCIDLEDDMKVDMQEYSSKTELQAAVNAISGRDVTFNDVTVYAMDLDDLGMEEGRISEEMDLPCDDLPSTMDLPRYEDDELERIRGYQRDDETIEFMLKYVKGEIEQPNKMKVLTLSPAIQDCLRHRSSFRVNDQGVLLRIWLDERGDMKPLVMIGERQFDVLLAETHSFDPKKGNRTNISHQGINRSFSCLKQVFYLPKMKKKIVKFITSCAECQLNNHVNQAKADPDGSHISFEPLDLQIIDYLGPLRGWAGMTGGAPRYVCFILDSATRFLITFSTPDVSDKSTFEALLNAREKCCGFPRKISSDNAIFREHSASKKFLEESGVSIMHGKAYTSKDQCKVERVIGSLTRTICKLHSQTPSASFNRILMEATLSHNCSLNAHTKKSPRELFFVRSSSNFLNTTPKDVRPASQALKSAVELARARQKDSLLDEVRQFVRRSELMSATQFSKRLKVGQLCLKRRTSYPMGSIRKIAHKLSIDCFKVIDRVATNTYRVESIIDKDIYIYPGDLLIPLRHHDEDEARKLVGDMQDVVRRNQARASASASGNRPRRTARPTVATCDVEGPEEADDLRWLFQPITHRSTCR